MPGEKNPYKILILSAIFLLALLTCGLGMWGFYIAYHTEIPHSLYEVSGAFGENTSVISGNNPDHVLDFIYYTAQLFTLSSGAHVEVNNWQLEIARFLAPVLTISSLLIIFWALLDRIRFIRLFLSPGHVVICGCGYLGPALVRYYSEREKRFVVLIEKDPDNPSLDVCRDLGAMVIIGNAVNENLLRRVRLSKASEIFLVTGNDDINAEITVLYKKILTPGSNLWEKMHICKMKFPLNTPRCHVHIEDALLSRTLSTTHPVLKNSHNIEFFNLYRIAGYCVQKINPAPFTNEEIGEGKTPHLLVIGFGRMGENFVLQVVKRWRTSYCRNDLNITIVGRTATKRVEELKAWYPSLKNYCVIKTVDEDTRTIGLLEFQTIFSASAYWPITRVYICADNTSKSVSIALMIIEKLKKPDLPVIVRSLYEDGITQVIKEFQKLGSHQHLIPFPIVGSPCCMEWITGGTRNSLAKMIHEAYLTERRRKNTLDDPESEEKNQEEESISESGALVEWKDLDEGFREATRLQVDDIRNKLDVIGYDIEPLTDWETESVSFTKEEIEDLARMEHERWRRAKKDAGYHLGDVTNEKKKTNRWMKLYDELPEKQKDMDRVMVQNIPSMLYRIHFKVVRKSQPPASRPSSFSPSPLQQ